MVRGVGRGVQGVWGWRACALPSGPRERPGPFAEARSLERASEACVCGVCVRPPEAGNRGGPTDSLGSRAPAVRRRPDIGGRHAPPRPQAHDRHQKIIRWVSNLSHLFSKNWIWNNLRSSSRSRVRRCLRTSHSCSLCFN